ncbi:MAG: hypothetical protein RBG13Loki_1856 [Promethearchaeota archaeon CR_4]|nr:MAG: hypothetical protein RBG13Loki_1856 [Candidatus Lokiarchaeota archaeon CR_4]
MNKEQRYETVVKLVVVILCISVILSIIDIFLVLWINKIITLNQSNVIIFYLLVMGLEISRITLLTISIMLIIKFKEISRKSKIKMLIAPLAAFGFIFSFLVRIIGFDCFPPLDSFSATFFTIISYILINSQKRKIY